MYKGIFNNVTTVEALQKRMYLNQGEILENEEVLSSKYAIVEDAPLIDCTYIGSASRQGVLLKHYFAYGDSFKGLASCEATKSDIIAELPPSYIAFNMLAKDCWLLTDLTGSQVLYINGVVLPFSFC